MRTYRQHEQLRAGLKKLLPKAKDWVGAIYRFTEIEYANGKDLLTGAGARKHGGRWNPPTFNCVYGSLDPATAQEVSFATFDKFGIPRSKASPRVRVAIELKLQRVLDLSSPSAFKVLGVTRRQLARVDWEAENHRGSEALTQAIGRVAFEERLEGIIVLSFTTEGRNLVLFPGRRLVGSSWKIVGARKLPRQR